MTLLIGLNSNGSCAAGVHQDFAAPGQPLIATNSSGPDYAALRE